MKRPMPSFFVAGMPRCGGAALMRAVASSSPLIPLVSQAVADHWHGRQVDHLYDPNPHGYWRTDDPTDAGPGGLARLDPGDCLRLPAGTHQVVWLGRDLTQVAASYKAAFGWDWPDSEADGAELARGVLAQRRDVRLTVVAYEELVTEPRVVFGRLRRAGWPVDPAKAATFVDPGLWRHR